MLDGRGADVFMVETFYDLDELVDAVEAVRSVSSLPIVALLTFDESGETLAGVTAAEAAARLAELDVAAIGANHGAGLACRARRARADGQRREAACGAPERRAREPDGRPRHLSRMRRPSTSPSSPRMRATSARS